MEPKIRYKYQYYLFILTFGAVGIASVINYLYWGKVLLALRNLIITFIWGAIFISIIPAELFSSYTNIMENFGFIYIYLVSIPISYWLIWDQKKYMEKKVVRNRL